MYYGCTASHNILLYREESKRRGEFESGRMIMDI